MSKVNWIPFEDTFFKEYQHFAWKCYGQKAYQTKLNYINWLYKENPISLKKEDFLIGVTEEKELVVGCIHKMRLHWRYQGNLIDMPALHNLIVDEDYRNGTGFMLVMASTANEQYGLIPGVSPPFTEFYEKLKYQKVTAQWYRKLLKPLRGLSSYAVNKFMNRTIREAYFSSATHCQTDVNGFTTTVQPDNDLLEQLAVLMNTQDIKTASPFWTTEQLRWRFFHPLGPGHLLIYEPFNESIKNFAILSLGPRHGMNVGRILVLKNSSLDSLKKLMTQISRVIKENGGHMLQFFCAEEQIYRGLDEMGWNRMKSPPDTYFFHKKKKQPFDHYSFMGNAGDFGFEGIQ